jgi:LysM repeat protein
MHRDLKLGLALAVLLIGSTTAFFFRNDADLNAGLPQLKHAEELDRAVAAREVAPYLPSAVAEAKTDVASTASPWAKPAFLGGSMTSLVGSTAITPDPIQIVMEEELTPARSAESVNRVPIAPAERDADGTPIYVVQSGDTLSGIAGRYLGSIARFDEIYELNRDQLAGPHALKIGMKLKLPSENAVESPAQQAAPASSVAEATTSEVSLVRENPPAATSDDAGPTPLPETTSSEAEEPSAPSAEGLFKPAKRTPFVPSRYRAPKLGP